MKKGWLILFVIFFAHKIYAQGFTVNDLHVDIAISKDGYFDVVEKYAVTFSEKKHGLLRRIFCVYTVKDANGHDKDITFSITNLSVPGWKYSKSLEGGDVSIKIGNADKYVNGHQEYTIKYRVKHAFFYNDSSTRFYWNILSDGWQADFEKVSYSIHLPEHLPLTNKDYFVYTGYNGTNDNKATIACRDRVISGEATEILGKGKALTVLINLPAVYIRQPDKP